MFRKSGLGFVVNDWTAGILFSTATAIAAWFSSASPSSEEEAERSGEDSPQLITDHICYISESKFRKKGSRTSILFLDDGRRLESDIPLREWRVAWPRFLLSETGAITRHVSINPGKVVEIGIANFRRFDRDRPDTVVHLAGGGVVVLDHGIEEVREKLG